MNRPRFSLLFLSVCFSLARPSLGDSPGSWIDLDGSGPGRRPTAEVLRSDPTETLIRFSIPGFWDRSVDRAGASYARLQLPGQGSTLEVGCPQLPAICELVAVPATAEVRVEIVQSRETVLSGYRVYPSQQTFCEGDPVPAFYADPAAYARDSFYPAERAAVGAPGIWRDLRVVDLRVHPLRHNPVTGELRACSEILVRLSYDGVSDVNAKRSPARPIAAGYERIYRQAVLNYDQLGLPQRQPQDPADKLDGAYDYLIIAADAYVDALAGFAAHKTDCGLAVNIVPASTAGSNAPGLKDFISAEYLASGISYVLLAGNENDIPTYMGYGGASDYYYTTIEGEDEYPELAIGRFCVADAIQLQNMIAKSIAFEASPPLGDWLEKSLLIAGVEGDPYNFQACKEVVQAGTGTLSGTYGLLFPYFTTAYGGSVSLGGDEATNADLINYFNEGFRLVNFRGHGYEYLWFAWNIFAEHFDIQDVELIDNGQYTPVVFSITCRTNAIAKNYLTLGEAFTRDSDCAVAFLGASESTITQPNYDYDIQLYAMIFDEGVNAIGDASNAAGVRIINLWGVDGIKNVHRYLWLGDPALQLILQAGAPPPGLQLVSPLDGSVFDPPAQVLLDWEDLLSAVSYRVMVDDDLDFGSPVADQEGLTLSEWTTPELGEGEYFWRVQAHDGESYGPWSDVWSFQVAVSYVPPVLLAPADGATVRDPDGLELEWYEVPGAVDYYLELDDSPGFASPLLTAFVETTGGETCAYEVVPELDAGTYYWRVKVDDPLWPWSATWNFKVRISNSKKDPIVPPSPRVTLLGSQPNPFNPATRIHFDLPRSLAVRLRVYDITGRLIRTLLDGRVLPEGRNSVLWDGKDSAGRTAATGSYFCRLEAGGEVASQRMILVK